MWTFLTKHGKTTHGPHQTLHSRGPRLLLVPHASTPKLRKPAARDSERTGSKRATKASKSSTPLSGACTTTGDASRGGGATGACIAGVDVTNGAGDASNISKLSSKLEKLGGARPKLDCPSDTTACGLARRGDKARRGGPARRNCIALPAAAAPGGAAPPGAQGSSFVTSTPALASGCVPLYAASATFVSALTALKSASQGSKSSKRQLQDASDAVCEVATGSMAGVGSEAKVGATCGAGATSKFSKISSKLGRSSGTRPNLDCPADPSACGSAGRGDEARRGGQARRSCMAPPTLAESTSAAPPGGPALLAGAATPGAAPPSAQRSCSYLRLHNSTRSSFVASAGGLASGCAPP
mmetsp:Transcript_23563/g.70780  ORF Transcript_23563/g.70780 Transcript_23563/m.70780 type:complete len:355 (-) Transcript_23563:401-1465(-)